MAPVHTVSVVRPLVTNTRTANTRVHSMTARDSSWNGTDIGIGPNIAIFTPLALVCVFVSLGIWSKPKSGPLQDIPRSDMDGEGVDGSSRTQLREREEELDIQEVSRIFPVFSYTDRTVSPVRFGSLDIPHLLTTALPSRTDSDAMATQASPASVVLGMADPSHDVIQDQQQQMLDKIAGERQQAQTAAAAQDAPADDVAQTVQALHAQVALLRHQVEQLQAERQDSGREEQSSRGPPSYTGEGNPFED
jgi:hypothetical protein